MEFTLQFFGFRMMSLGPEASDFSFGGLDARLEFGDMPVSL